MLDRWEATVARRSSRSSRAAGDPGADVGTAPSRAGPQIGARAHFSRLGPPTDASAAAIESAYRDIAELRRRIVEAQEAPGPTPPGIQSQATVQAATWARVFRLDPSTDPLAAAIESAYRDVAELRRLIVEAQEAPGPTLPGAPSQAAVQAATQARVFRLGPSAGAMAAAIESAYRDIAELRRLTIEAEAAGEAAPARVATIEAVRAEAEAGA
jgi:hypothetical protein